MVFRHTRNEHHEIELYIRYVIVIAERMTNVNLFKRFKPSSQYELVVEDTYKHISIVNNTQYASSIKVNMTDDFFRRANIVRSIAPIVCTVCRLYGFLVKHVSSSLFFIMLSFDVFSNITAGDEEMRSDVMSSNSSHPVLLSE
uniref:ORF21 n=1 Tax=Malaco herpesvirus 4 TaxID=3031800 RepID=A0AA48P899_9VIRU|nr:TPA_asm: ORF21 [Malaco herpesvirus 4]